MITGQQRILAWSIKTAALMISLGTGCVAAPPQALRAASEIQRASTSIFATLENYHDRAVASLEDARVDAVTRFVSQLRLRIARRDPIEDQTLRFKAALDSLQRQRLADEAGFVRAGQEIRTIRTASQKMRVAIAQGAKLDSHLRRLVDVALDRVLAGKPIDGDDDAEDSP